MHTQLCQPRLDYTFCFSFYILFHPQALAVVAASNAAAAAVQSQVHLIIHFVSHYTFCFSSNAGRRRRANRRGKRCRVNNCAIKFGACPTPLPSIKIRRGWRPKIRRPRPAPTAAEISAATMRLGVTAWYSFHYYYYLSFYLIFFLIIVFFNHHCCRLRLTLSSYNGGNRHRPWWPPPPPCLPPNPAPFYTRRRLLRPRQMH